ncbi:MAG TPA: Uma2 family endonuclease [Candidatus Competibacteraceae bacterium]|nr:Uma2 family endonuclease [Candidatus Competibacteraceae bacterium]HRZ04838.1 Uma2 family endonuclease [Candidatus Competibacteraceae bacterium]HSA45445.1 Uma2 family endonuclease [Candidatus Competibacteraceae bacterium]
MSTLLYPVSVIDYPDEDGQPMAESDFQRTPLIYAVESLRIYFQDREDVYVSGNMFVYYEQGNPKAVVAPDVFVVIGAPRHDRASYKLWEEPKGPDFVLEITSKSTYTEDQGVKRGVYALLGVREYWQYDPTGDYLKPVLQGWQLIERNYWPLPARRESNGSLLMHSVALGLDVQVTDGKLRFHDPVTGRILHSHAEAVQAWQQAEQAQRQAEQAQRQAEQAQRQAEARADYEAAQRQALQVRLAELEAQLRG